MKKQTTSNIAAAMVHNVGAYNVTGEIIRKYGGKWNETYALYFFPDGSHGAFTDLSGGAAQKTRAGEPVLHFAVGN